MNLPPNAVRERGRMNRSDLVDTIKDTIQVTRKEAERIVEVFFKTIEDTLTSGDRVEIRGFGSFAVREYESYTGRNPKTGQKITVSPKKLPYFKPGKELKEMVDIA
ncbi:MAG: HU family DNA-binding protein [Desulfobacterales bacterium]